MGEVTLLVSQMIEMFKAIKMQFDNSQTFM